MALIAQKKAQWAEIQQGKDDELLNKDFERRVKAIKWVDKEIRKLIDVLQKYNGKCLFGILFEATVQSFEAISGTLVAAKKRGVVIYEGHLLMSGSHDDVLVTLIKTSIEDSPLPSKESFFSRPRKASAAFKAINMQNDKCFKCQKTVYISERINAAGKTFHTQCFVCEHCKNRLKPTEYCTINNKIYCKPHYMQIFQTKGGYSGFGDESSKQKESVKSVSPRNEEKKSSIFNTFKAVSPRKKTEEKKESVKPVSPRNEEKKSSIFNTFKAISPRKKTEEKKESVKSVSPRNEEKKSSIFNTFKAISPRKKTEEKKESVKSVSPRNEENFLFKNSQQSFKQKDNKSYQEKQDSPKLLEKTKKMYCFCGNMLDSSCKFCTDCGRPLKSPTSSPPSSKKINKPIPESPRKNQNETNKLTSNETKVVISAIKNKQQQKTGFFSSAVNQPGVLHGIASVLGFARCVVINCEDPEYKHNYCRDHYNNFKRNEIILPRLGKYYAPIQKLLDFLLENGTYETDIFRTCFEPEEMKKLSEQIDTNNEKIYKNIDLSSYSISSIAFVLKRWLARNDPVFPYKAYETLMNIQEKQKGFGRVLCIAMVISDLPIGSQVLIFKLLDLFNQIIQHQQITQMDKQKISYTFGPALLRPKIINDLTRATIEAKFIDNYHTLFDDADCFSQ